jgi:Protein of unknown function (DUF2934)
METPFTPIIIEHAEDIEARKSELAFQFWEEDGRPEGKAEEHWNKACLVLMSMEEELISDPEWLQRNVKSENVESPKADQTSEPQAAETTIESIQRRLVSRAAA